MIVEEHTAAYINSLEGDLPKQLKELELWAQQHAVPIIRKEAQTLLRFLLKLKCPERILEIGTAIGFSATFMSEYMPENAVIHTIEKVQMRISEAKRNIAASKNAEKIKLITGDAAKVLKELSEPYDFIFLDAAKGQYMNFLPDILRLLKTGGILVTDNVLQEGSIAWSKYSVERRDRTIHTRMREYLYTITHSDCLETTVLPVGDGMTLSLKIQ